MKKLFFVTLCLSALLFTDASAFVRSTDNILDESKNSVYMIGWVYARLSSLPRASNDTSQIYNFDLNKNVKNAYYQFSDGVIDRLILSPDAKLIALLRGYTGWLGQQSELIILDKERRQEVLSFRDEIADYKWSPDSNKIVYITGGDVEGRGFRSTGVWVYDLQKKEKIKIAEKANDVEWFPTGDICVVVYENKSERKGKGEAVYNSFIYRYADKAVEGVGLKGVKFSLDGKYSITVTRDYGNITADEKSIRINFYNLMTKSTISTSKLSEIISEPSRIIWDSFTWLKRNRIVFEKKIDNSVQRDILICDIENNKVLKILKGNLVGTNSDRSKVVLFDAGRFDTVIVP